MSGRRFIYRLDNGEHTIMRMIDLGWIEERDKEEQKEILWEEFMRIRWEMDKQLRPEEFKQ